MAVIGYGSASKAGLSFRRLLAIAARKVPLCRPPEPILFALVSSPPAVQSRCCSSVAEAEALADGGAQDHATVSVAPDRKSPERSDWPAWKTMSSKELGITSSMITDPVKFVIRRLREKGYVVYLVGGCVRDIIMKRTPKDFDVITSADLKEVKKVFSWCDIVGRRFPICHVHIADSLVEVSSFNTWGRNQSHGSAYTPRRLHNCDKLDLLRWRNCMRRDFTINGLMFNPYSHQIYDYLGGIEDIKKGKVRTVIPARTSFNEDCARILRAIRIAARLGFQITRETAESLKNLASSVLQLDKGRLLMEMNYMLAYGSAETSLRLLWKFGLLELLLPIQAAYFVSRGFRRRDSRYNMLLALFSNLDKLLAPNRPCDNSLWVAILAFHQALVDEPRDPLVIATFALALYNGGDMWEAIHIARSIDIPHSIFPELSAVTKLDVDEDLAEEVLHLASSARTASRDITDKQVVSKAMAKYPQAPVSDLVFIPINLYSKVLRIFDCIQDYGKERVTPGRSCKADCHGLAHARLAEVRQAFARVVFDTVYPPKRSNTK